MEHKNKYSDRRSSIRGMEDVLTRIWSNNILGPLNGESLEELNYSYRVAREAAITFGEDVNKYPKRIRWRTKGLEIVEGVRSL